MPRIHLKKIWEDSDGIVEITVTALNDSYMASEDCYVYPDRLDQFGNELQVFPQSIDHEVTLKFGADRPDWYKYILLRVFVYDSAGHSAIEVKTDNHSIPPEYSSANIFLICEPAALNRIGKEISDWTHKMNEPFDFEW